MVSSIRTPVFRAFFVSIFACMAAPAAAIPITASNTTTVAIPLGIGLLGVARHRRRIVATAVSSVFLLAAAGHVSAAPIQFDNRAAFEAAVGGLQTVTFDDVSSDVNLSGAAYDAGPFTVTGPSCCARIDADGSGSTPVNGTPYIQGLGGGGTTMTFTFDAPITAFGVDMFGINDGAERTRIVIGGTTYQLPVGGNVDVASFFGLFSDAPFSIVTFSVISGEDAGLDNISFSPAPAAVPEPTSIALLATGLAGAVLRRRRRA